MSKISRRKFIFTTGTTAAAALLINGCTSSSDSANSGSNATDSAAAPSTLPAAEISPEEAPEITTAKLGFIALTDSAPLIIAKEKGIFDKYGMTGVEVLKQASWPVTRDNMELGSGGGGIDGAHILTPMPYLMTLGKVTKQPLPMYILARLNVNGQGISVGNDYTDLKIGTDSSKMTEVFAKAKANNKELSAAMTFPGGTHDLWLRYWLAAGGINPETDISVVPVPPPQMVANMKIGAMETFCVGEPWNAQLVNQKQGYSALVTGELWQDHPEKAFAMRADWVDANPKAALAMTKAVLEAQQWCDLPENQQEMCEIVSQDKWFKVPVEDIIGRIQGKIDYGNGRTVEDPNISMKFWRDNASYPYKSHDLWFLTENIRWGYIPADTDTKALVDKVNRSDIWKEAAKAIGVAETDIPTSDSRGVETFFDGVKFDPEDPKAYLDSLKIKKV
ncbi:MAG: bicarbonate-binding protein [Phormidesmis priestleyi]|uniref:Bicarbonate-binding protein n=1 Tax=Phormidesmis priestleyi TaxID=268141 RepID=A0A2W4XUR0_9CYAN|nr:MAG: bicarbonate-binding protein [Phormidesmis priestleyi]